MSYITLGNLTRFLNKLKNYLSNNYLKLTGGTVTGDTIFRKKISAHEVCLTGLTDVSLKNKGNGSITKGAWTILDESNYNLFTPTLNGTGATGTWDINISGNALNDSEGNKIVDTYAKKSEVGGTPEWKEAYNALRKRSYPTEFDNDELTLIMDTPILDSDTSIILSQPYTNFDGLLFDIMSQNSDAICERIYVSSAEIDSKNEIARNLVEDGYGIGIMFLFSHDLYCACPAYDISTTEFHIYKRNCDIRRICGVKFKEIT